MAANQSKILDIPIIPQPGTKLCWAASMKMAMNTIDANPEVVLLALVEHLRKTIMGSGFRGLSDNDIDGFTDCAAGSFIDNSTGKEWNIVIPNYEGGVINYFDAIFLESDFYSIEENLSSMEEKDTNMIWNLIVNQIKKQKRPLILVIKDEVYTHAVVIRGYWIRNNVKYLCVNDPLSNRPCEGECYSLHYNNLMSGNFRIKAKSLIHNIRLKIDFSLVNVNGDFTIVDNYDQLSDNNVLRINDALGGISID